MNYEACHVVIMKELSVNVEGFPIFLKDWFPIVTHFFVSAIMFWLKILESLLLTALLEYMGRVVPIIVVIIL